MVILVQTCEICAMFHLAHRIRVIREFDSLRSRANQSGESSPTPRQTDIKASAR